MNMSTTDTAPRTNTRRSGAVRETISVLGITPSGEVPLVASAEGFRLPECSSGPAALRDVQERLREETGYEAAEFVLMTSLRPSSGRPSGPTILMAPRLSPVGPRPRGLELVPLADLLSWLNARRASGAVVDPRVSMGVMMAERHFPRWALARLQDALRHLRAAGPGVAATG